MGERHVEWCGICCYCASRYVWRLFIARIPLLYLLHIISMLKKRCECWWGNVHICARHCIHACTAWHCDICTFILLVGLKEVLANCSVAQEWVSKAWLRLYSAIRRCADQDCGYSWMVEGRLWRTPEPCIVSGTDRDQRHGETLSDRGHWIVKKCLDFGHHWSVLIDTRLQYHIEVRDSTMMVVLFNF